MTCQIQPCAKPGELACTLGGTSRRVLCVDHQVRMRTAALMGGRSIVIHHGVDLDTWRADELPVEDVPYLGLPHEGVSTYPLAESSQYQRGRDDERAAVAEYLRRWEPGLARAIARGDHLEGK
jgi:hypothetical protein